MKVNVLVICLISFVYGMGQTSVDFDKYFTDNTLRYDFCLTGNDSSEIVSQEQIKKEPYWGGSLVNLIDTFKYGSYFFYVYDSLSGELIYSRGFCTLFTEWQSTKEAENTVKSFYETIVFPFPKVTVELKLYIRDYNGDYKFIYSHYINPKSIFISNEMKTYETQKIVNNGDSHKHMDIVFLPDGYTEDEMTIFLKDAKHYADVLFSNEPFTSCKEKINLWAVLVPSKESGTDNPGVNVWKNTALNSSFYTFGIERYLTTLDIKSVRDAAANVPYDQIYILVNTEKYGGGGVYNYYSLTSAHDGASDQVFVHELGHALGGLADEYYTSSVAVEDYYSFSVEPWEPNITTLVDFDSKWKNMVDKKTPVPTPMIDKYEGKVGAFEGAGYSAKKIYRPYYNCTMKSLSAGEGFCPVCRKAIRDIINFYSE